MASRAMVTGDVEVAGPSGVDTRRRRRVVVAVVVAAVLAGVGWWATSADAVRPGHGQPSMAGSLALGEPFYVGLPGMAERDVVATSLHPVVTPGLEAEVLVCHRDPSYGASVGGGGRSDIEDACERLVPANGETLVEAHAADTYLVVEVTRTDGGPQRLCGVDVRYRDGWRWGSETRAGTDVLFDVGEDPLDDPSAWPPCP